MEVVALDCEMVGAGYRGQVDLLARISVVNERCEVLYDRYVEPFANLDVTDYRTWVSGIRAWDICIKRIYNPEDVVRFEEAQCMVRLLIEGRVLVGHDIAKDLKVLQLTHPSVHIRDTSLYAPFQRFGKAGAKPSLKTLASCILNRQIQHGEHDSVEDAAASMALYKEAKRVHKRNIVNCWAHSSDLEEIIFKQANLIKKETSFCPALQEIQPEYNVRFTYFRRLKCLIVEERERRQEMARMQKHKEIMDEAIANHRKWLEEERRQSRNRWCIFVLVALFFILLAKYCYKPEEPPKTPKNWFQNLRDRLGFD